MVTDWVLMAVPSTDYDELKALVDARQQERGEAKAPSIEQLRSTQLAVAAVERNALDAYVPWPVSALNRLSTEATVTTERFARAMDVCAAQPETWFSTEEIAQRLDITVNEWRAACRKLRAHLNKHYPDVPQAPGKEPGFLEWPVVALAGRERAVYDQLYIAVTAEQARRWKDVREGRA
jgi:hypothetical protein